MPENKQILFVEYKFRGGWQYYKNQNGNRVKDGTVRYYSHSFLNTILEGEEDKGWEKILLKFPKSKSREFVIKDKEVVIKSKVGRTAY